MTAKNNTHGRGRKQNRDLSSDQQINKLAEPQQSHAPFSATTGARTFSNDEPSEPGVNREAAVLFSLTIDGTGSLLNTWDGYTRGLHQMFDSCRQHPMARTCARVSVGIGGGPTFSPTPFLPFSEAQLPTFTPQGGSFGAMWMTKGLEHLGSEQEALKRDAVLINKKIYLFISDWHFDDQPEDFHRAVEAYREAEKAPNFNGFIVTAGDRPNVAVASRVSKKCRPLHLDALKVDQLFEWFTGVIRLASQSQPGQSVSLPPPNWELKDGPR